MKKIAIGVSVLFALNANLSFASDSNNCGNFNVIISNNTNEACDLIGYQLIHGLFKYTSSVPAFIPANSTTTPITITQSLFGPEMKVTYRCGRNKEITLNSSQSLCFMSAGKITGEVGRAHSLNATYTKHEGSFLWSQHGTIQWKLSSLPFDEHN